MLYPVGFKVKCTKERGGFKLGLVYSISCVNLSKKEGTSYNIKDNTGLEVTISVYDFEKYFEPAKVKKYNRPDWW